MARRGEHELQNEYTLALLTRSEPRALAACLSALRRYEEAERLLLESFPVLRRTLGDEDENTRRTANRITDLYEQWGLARSTPSLH